MTPVQTLKHSISLPSQLDEMRNKITSKCNTFWSMSDHKSSTPQLYEHFLKNVTHRSNVCVVCPFTAFFMNQTNADLIRDKNINMTFFNVDKKGLGVEELQCHIDDANLKAYMNIIQDAFCEHIANGHYDYIVFMESVPLIEKGLFHNMLSHSYLHLMHASSRVVCVHNMCQDVNTLVSFAKPRLKYVPGIWTDYGILVSKSDFEETTSDCGFHVNDMKVLCSDSIFNIIQSKINIPNIVKRSVNAFDENVCEVYKVETYYISMTHPETGSCLVD